MAKTNLASMSIDALLTLRSEIEKTLSRKAAQLKELYVVRAFRTVGLAI
jgi:hypothetical protein